MQRYVSLLEHPRMTALFATALLARLPIGINGLAVILFLRAETGSFSVAGAVAGGFALGTGLAAPLAGRLVDRVGVRVLVPLGAGHAGGVLALLALGSRGAPAGLLLAVAILAGALFPPTPATLRARIPQLLSDRPELVRSAYALDSVLLELTFVCAPLLVAALVVLLTPQAALVVSAAAVLAGTASFIAVMPSGAAVTGRERGGGLLGPMREPGIQTLTLTMLPIGVAFGALEVALPAFAHEHADPELAGVLLAVWAFGSAVGGLVYGARRGDTPLAELHMRLTLVLPLAFVPLLIAPPTALFALLLLPAGFFIAPIIASRNELAGEVAPPGTETEALTWPLTALVGGVSLGAAMAGSLVDGSGSRAAIAAAVASAALGGLIATARRATLRAAPAAA
ncbi:MAG TPA: MFS transporter [Thermoleophilaceae bacterium]